MLSENPDPQGSISRREEGRKNSRLTENVCNDLFPLSTMLSYCTYFVGMQKQITIKQEAALCGCFFISCDQMWNSAGIILATLDSVHTLHRHPVRKLTQDACDKSANFTVSLRFPNDASLIKQSRKQHIACPSTQTCGGDKADNRK